MLTALRPHVATAYEQLSGSVRTARVQYLSSLEEDLAQDALSAAEAGDSAPGDASRPDVSALETLTRQELAALMLQRLQSSRRAERDRAMTLVGPHRDDVNFSLDQVPVKGFASHGETWSFALALRLGAYRVMVDDDPEEGARPVLILDDVFAELDARRRRRLAELAAEAEQLIVTAAVDDDVPEALLGNALRVESVDQLSQVSVHEQP
jgi:DNA replication and repair protein RecF